MTDFLSGEENIYRRTINADENYYRRKIFADTNFIISKIFWNLFRAFIFIRVALKYRPSNVRLNIWPTVNTYTECKIPVESWAFSFFLFHKYFETWITKVDIAHVTFPDVKRNNQWHEKKALHNGITGDPLCIRDSGNIQASGNISLKLFMTK